MTTTLRKQNIATTILQQIGLQARLSVALRNPIAIDGDDGLGGLRCRYGFGSAKRIIEVHYTAMDTYTVKVLYVPNRGKKAYIPQVRATWTDQYFDDLPYRVIDAYNEYQ